MTAALAVLLLTLAACGEDGDSEAVPAEDPVVTQEETVPEAGAVELMVGESSLGTILTDAEGMSLYMFDPDEQGASTCYDDCATAWPPLTTEGAPAAGNGVDGGLLGVVERNDGSQQVTYDGWPLYYWQGDAQPGAVNGQAVNEVWWVLGPDGEPIRG